MVSVPAPLRVTPETVISCPLVETVPNEAEVHPGLADVIGAVQPAGTVSVIDPFATPPAAAVYVNVIADPEAPADTVVTELVRVPLPLAAYTVIAGEDARFVSVPVEIDFSCACHVAVPEVAVAVAPVPVPARDP